MSDLIGANTKKGEGHRCRVLGLTVAVSMSHKGSTTSRFDILYTA